MAETTQSLNQSAVQEISNPKVITQQESSKPADRREGMQNLTLPDWEQQEAEAEIANALKKESPHEALQALASLGKAEANEVSVSTARELPSEPGEAITTLFADIDVITESPTVPNKPVAVKEFTTLLKTIAKSQSPDINRLFRTDPHFKDLGITSSVRNWQDKEIHTRILTYFKRHNIPVSEQDRQDIVEYSKKEDVRAKKQLMQSYARNGILTLKSAVKKEVLKETSGSPGDIGFDVNTSYLLTDDNNNIRGYEVQASPIDNRTFYGSNSFFRVVLERGGEGIDRASLLPKEEVENRTRASILFVVKADKLALSRRNENVHQEDLALSDIPPEAIDYIIVDSSNFSTAQEAFGHLPVEIRSASPVSADLDTFYKGPYTVPNYKDEVENIVKKDGAVWCHIARLPVETYPSEEKQ